MPSWTNTTLSPELPRPPTGTSGGILRPADDTGRPASARFAPGPDVGAYVEHYWALAWDVVAPARRAVLSHPAIHLTVEDGGGRLHGHGLPAVLVHGVVRRTFEVDLTPTGWVFGARFRPGGFTALTGIAARTLTDRVVLASSVLEGTDRLPAEVGSADPVDRAASFESWLAERIPPSVDPGYERVLGVVAALLTDRTLHRVDDVADAAGCSVRSLQRLFSTYVGVGPKWLITRYRLHDALAAIDDGRGDDAPDLAELAVSLGWFDQAHFTRDFTAHVGVSPLAYRARRP